jgi:hypothetical protein
MRAHHPFGLVHHQDQGRRRVQTRALHRHPFRKIQGQGNPGARVGHGLSVQDNGAVADHRVDFQRASHVLANAVTIPNAMNDKKRAAMSMHRVSEHREEDEDEEEGGGKKRSTQRLSGIKVTTGGDEDEVVSGGSSPDKFGSRKISASGKKKHQPLLYNNAWVVDEEGREIQQPPNDDADGGAVGP